MQKFHFRYSRLGWLFLIGTAQAQTSVLMSEWLARREGAQPPPPPSLVAPVTAPPPLAPPKVASTPSAATPSAATPSALTPEATKTPAAQAWVSTSPTATTVSTPMAVLATPPTIPATAPLAAPKPAEATGGVAKPVPSPSKPHSTWVQVEWVEMQRTHNLSRPFAPEARQPGPDKAAYLSSAVRLSSANEPDEPVNRVWDVRLQDVSVRRMLQRWAQDAQYQLIWEASRDFPVQVELVIEGDFRNAVGTVMEALSMTDYPVQALINSELRQMRVVRYLQGQAR